MLKPGPMERSLKPRPRIPSNSVDMKGWSVSPVPKVMVAWPFSISTPALGLPPASSIFFDPEDLLASYMRWRLQAGESQLASGRIRFPLPVSKITVNCCGGEPMEISPQYAVLCVKVAAMAEAAVEWWCTREETANKSSSCFERPPGDRSSAAATERMLRAHMAGWDEPRRLPSNHLSV